jgi:hypothetical protein
MKLLKKSVLSFTNTLTESTTKEYRNRRLADKKNLRNISLINIYIAYAGVRMDYTART